MREIESPVARHKELRLRVEVDLEAVVSGPNLTPEAVRCKNCAREAFEAWHGAAVTRGDRLGLPDNRDLTSSSAGFRKEYCVDAECTIERYESNSRLFV